MPTPAQLKAIHALRRQVPHLVEDDTWREFLGNVSGKRSSRDLTEAEARRVLGELDRLATGRVTRPAAQLPNPKGGLVRRILREAYTAQWDLPQEAGAFDGSDQARSARVRQRVMDYLTQTCPNSRPARVIEDWPMEALQTLVEHLKGKSKAKTSASRR